MLAVTDVTKLPLTSLTTDHGQSPLPPPPSSVFVVSDTQEPFRSASLSLYFFLLSFSLVLTSLVQTSLVQFSSVVHFPISKAHAFSLHLFVSHPYILILLFAFIYIK